MVENGLTVEVEMPDGQARIGYVGIVCKIWDTSNGKIKFWDRDGKDHYFETTDEYHRHLYRRGDSGNPVLEGNAGIGFPDSLVDTTVFVLSRGKVIGYGSYREYLGAV